jgi:hypothetical protein
MSFTASLLEYSSVVPLMAAQEFTTLIECALAVPVVENAKP